MKRPPRPGINVVVARELRHIRRDHVALGILFVVPVLAFLVLGWNFSNAVIRGLKVSIVDLDETETSRGIVQSIAAAPGVSLVERASDLTRAMLSIRSGDTLASVYIPQNFERDLVHGRRPQLVAFYNSQYMTPGNAVAAALQSSINTAAALAAPAPAPDAAPVGSLLVEQYVLTNPALNYAQFLLRAVLPTVLHVVMAVAAAYLVGAELRRRRWRAWLRLAGGSPLLALAGKLLPLFAIFSVTMTLGMAILHGALHIPFRGDALIVIVAAALFGTSYILIATLLQLLLRNVGVVLSLVGLICSPAFGYAGVGFPVIAMNDFAQGWGSLLPLRWYIKILIDQASRGVPTAASAVPFAILAGMTLLLGLLCWLRLRALVRHPEPPAARPAPAIFKDSIGLGPAFVAESRRVLGTSGVFSLLVLAPVIYGMFYPQPYLGELLRSIPIAVVDHDKSELSRDLVQSLDADESLTVAMRAESSGEARRALSAGEVFAILEIPENTERDLLKGKAARIAAYVDSGYFLLYRYSLQGITEAAASVSLAHASGGARLDGSLARAALASVQPVELVMAPLYNPTGGYGSYVVPAAFILIIQQTLLMGAATLAGGAALAERAPRSLLGAASTVLGRALAHAAFYLPGLALFVLVLPRIYGFSTLGRTGDLLLLAAPFLLSVSLLGQLAGSLLRRPDAALVLLIATSLPLFFLVGLSWPREAMPPALQSLSEIFPSTSAIDAFLRVNQMGARLPEVAPDWIRLWALAGFFLILLIPLERAQSRAARHGG